MEEDEGGGERCGGVRAAVTYSDQQASLM